MDREAYLEAIARGDLPELGRLLEREPGLLEAETNPSYAPERPLRCTGLHAAAFMKYTDDSSDFIRMLLRRGADPGLETAVGRTALAIARKRFDVVIEILEGR